MTRRRAKSVLAAVMLAPVLVVVGGIAFRDGTSLPDKPVAASGAQADATAVTAASDLPVTIGALQARLERLPADDASWASLGFAYVAQARATADPSFYPKAEEAFARSLDERPDGNAVALAGQAVLANARHAFADGRRLAAAATAVDPYDPTAKGILADALLELGEYDAAMATLQEMVDLRPGVPSLTRVSYAYELRGDLEGARYALERALEMAVTPADASYCLLHLGHLAWASGNYDQASVHYAEGLRRDPSNTHLLAGRARAAAARGYPDAALRHYATVVQRLPEVTYLIEYGELLESLGHPVEAQAQYDVAEVTAALSLDADVVPDIEIAIYHADHGDPRKALEVARAQYDSRRSVQVEDALAWALHAAWRHEEALVHAEAAQRLGTRNALWDYHRGMIQAELGLVEEARASLTSALETNPAFSPLHAPRAHQALAALDRRS